MFDLLYLIVAFAGSILASLWDLKTTEIPDEIPYLMILIGLSLHAFESLIAWDYSPLLNSLIVGLAFLGFGFLMYFAGQWGGGDAKLLAAIGFLLPNLSENFSSKLILPFPLSYLFNVFMIGAIYMLFYAFVLALIKRRIWKKFFEDVKASSKFLTIGAISLFFLFLFFNWFLSLHFKIKFELLFGLKYSFLPMILTLAVFLLWKFAKAVEEVGFKRRIPVSELKVGDVLEESKLWEGITEKELRKIKRSGRKYVVIKEGVRFAPAFPLALAFTLWLGDYLLILLNLNVIL